MISFIRKRFTYANVAMTLALVFAMSGGAYAAKHYLITSTKQISPKVLKSLKGKRGPAGAQGAQGPAGPAGPAGKNGANGKDGTNGTVGANGVSPEGVAFSGSAHGCTEGGIEFKGANTTYACNGAQGKPGPFVTQVPTEGTLKGVWSALGQGSLEDVLIPVSFQFPISPAPTAILIYEGGEQALKVTPAGFKFPEDFLASKEAVEALCPGTAAAPTAEPGYVCFYIAKQSNMEYALTPAITEKELGTPTSFGVTVPVTGTGYVEGTWAATAG